MDLLALRVAAAEDRREALDRVDPDREAREMRAQAEADAKRAAAASLVAERLRAAGSTDAGIAVFLRDTMGGG